MKWTMLSALLLSTSLAFGATPTLPESSNVQPQVVAAMATQTSDLADHELSNTEVMVTKELQAGSPIEVKVNHAFSRDAARERVTYLLDYWNRRFGVKAFWRGFRVYLSGKVFGIQVKAAFDVGDHQVVAMSADPGRVFRSRASDYVEQKLKKYLSPTYEDP